MKRLYILTLLLTTGCVTDGYLHNNNHLHNNHSISISKNETPPKYGFFEKLSYIESRDSVTIYNKYGYMGKYQIGMMALKDVGYIKGESKDFFKRFQSDPHNTFPERVQDSVVKLIMIKNYQYLGKYVNCVGKEVGGITISLSGLIASCYLVGVGKTKIWIESKGTIIPRDGNGVRCIDYHEKFKGFDKEIEKIVIGYS